MSKKCQHANMNILKLMWAISYFFSVTHLKSFNEENLAKIADVLEVVSSAMIFLTLPNQSVMT